MRLSAIFFALTLTGMTVTAQSGVKQPTYNVESLGGNANTVFQELLKDTGRVSELRDDIEAELVEQVVWASLNDVTDENACDAMEIATGYSWLAGQFQDGTRMFTVDHLTQMNASPICLGHDTSIAANNFVEYVKKYGQKLKAGEIENNTSASEYLAKLIENMFGKNYSGSVVGNKFLLTIDPDAHREVKELISLLGKPNGGESKLTADSHKFWSKLWSTKWKGLSKDKPLGSVLASMFKKAGIDFVVHHESRVLMNEHLDYDHKHSTQLHMQISRLQKRYEFTFSAQPGYLVVGGKENFYRVFEVTNLLEKAGAAYKRQNTEKGLEQGFSGDIRSKGGAKIISTGLKKLLVGLGCEPEIFVYGSRIIVRGSLEDLRNSRNTLLDMGWTEAKEIDEKE